MREQDQHDGGDAAGHSGVFWLFHSTCLSYGVMRINIEIVVSTMMANAAKTQSKTRLLVGRCFGAWAGYCPACR